MSGLGKELRTGWRDLAGATIGLGCGVASYNPISSLFFRALEGQFGWSKSITAAALIAFPLTGLTLPAVGWLLDRLGVKPVAGVSSLLLSGILFGLSLIDNNLAIFYILYLGMNILGSGTGPVSYTRAIVANFRVARGTALAIVLLGIATAGLVLPQVVAPIVAAGNWRSAYRLLALITLAGGIAAFLLIRPNQTGRMSANEVVGHTPREAFGSYAFWLLAGAILLVSVASLGFVSQFQSILIEKGNSPIAAARLISLLAFSVCVSRLVVGWALDTLSPEKVAVVIFLLASVGMAMLLTDSGSTGVLVAVMLIGVSLGAELDIMSFFCARCFGLRHYGVIYGALSFFFYTGIAIGGLVYATMHDRSGVYQGPIALSSGMFFIAAMLFLAVRAAHTKAAAAEATLLPGGRQA